MQQAATAADPMKNPCIPPLAVQLFQREVVASTLPFLRLVVVVRLDQRTRRMAPIQGQQAQSSNNAVAQPGQTFPIITILATSNAVDPQVQISRLNSDGDRQVPAVCRARLPREALHLHRGRGIILVREFTFHSNLQGDEWFQAEVDIHPRRRDPEGGRMAFHKMDVHRPALCDQGAQPEQVLDQGVRVVGLVRSPKQAEREHRRDDKGVKCSH